MAALQYCNPHLLSDTLTYFVLFRLPKSWREQLKVELKRNPNFLKQFISNAQQELEDELEKRGISRVKQSVVIYIIVIACSTDADFLSVHYLT